jgi:dTDP-4-amino-4,6-dideoxygalactose transaminase
VAENEERILLEKIEDRVRSLPFGRPIIEEEERSAVMEVLSTPILVHGPRATRFEAEFAAYTGAPHAVSVSSCTAGMHLVWFARGLGPGDEVIMPAMTHVATAHAVELTGGKAVFVDAELQTGNIDTSRIAAAITPRTRGIVIVHYLGMPVDVRPVLKIAEQHGLFVMEDCALALGSSVRGVHAGMLGDCGVFSFYPVKHITTAEGGMVILKDPELARKIRLKKAFGVDRTHIERKIPGVYDVVDLGFNYRMSEIHAAIGIEQLKKAPRFLARRESNHSTLASHLKRVPRARLFSSSASDLRSSYYCQSVLLAQELSHRRAEIMARLAERGIGTSVYYPQPVPRMSYYARKYGWRNGSFPNAEIIADHSIALPVGPHLDPSDMEYIGHALGSAIEEVCQ